MPIPRQAADHATIKLGTTRTKYNAFSVATELEHVTQFVPLLLAHAWLSLALLSAAVCCRTQQV
jgi:hypothetical protein